MTDHLTTCLVEIKAMHASVKAQIRTTLETARRLGESLIAARKACREANVTFKDWIDGTGEMSYASASVYTRIAENWTELVDQWDFDTLTISEAIKRLTRRTNTPKREKPSDAPGEVLVVMIQMREGKTLADLEKALKSVALEVEEVEAEEADELKSITTPAH